MRVEFSVDLSGCQALDSPRPHGGLDRGGLTDFANAVETAGMDRLLLVDQSDTRDLATIASYILHATATLGIEIEHLAGTAAPEVAARQIATLDQLSDGRLSVRVVPPAGELASHEETFARLDEFLVLLKRLWANDSPIDYEGRFYRLQAAFSGAKPFHAGSVPLALAGASGTAVKVAARHADRFVLPAATVEETRRTIDRVKAAAAAFGRAGHIRFALPMRPTSHRFARAAAHQTSAAAQSLPVTGSPEKIALALLGYCEIGVTDFVVSGLDTPNEVGAFGATVVALVRRALAHRDGGAVDRSGVRAPSVFGRWQRTA
jgi:alkanesulfonate monooxygenase